jgi:hypothetical protein
MTTTPPGRAWKHALPMAAREAMEAVLDPAESVELMAPAVGSSLVLTQRRLIVVRDGANFRPKSGVRPFELAPGLSIRIGPRLRRVIIESDAGTISLFIRPEQLRQAETFVAEVRRRIRLDG